MQIHQELQDKEYQIQTTIPTPSSNVTAIISTTTSILSEDSNELKNILNHNETSPSVESNLKVDPNLQINSHFIPLTQPIQIEPEKQQGENGENVDSLRSKSKSKSVSRSRSRSRSSRKRSRSRSASLGKIGSRSRSVSKDKNNNDEHNQDESTHPLETVFLFFSFYFLF